MELRPYQFEAGQAIRECYDRGVRRQLIVLPTGCGKTVLFSALREFLPEAFPMLVLAHREELLVQAQEKITAANPGIHCEIEQGENYAASADVVVASVPTLGRADGRRIQRFPRDYFRTVVVDEAHHAAADSYRRILEYFGGAVHLGFTATPQRTDNARLTDVFDEISYFRTLGDMIHEGWLAPLIGYRLHTDVDLSEVRIVRGDFSEGELAAAVNTDARNEAIVDAYRTLADGRKVLVFCVDVAHAYAVRDHFVRSGYLAAAITGETPPDERRQALKDFRDGHLQILTNCMVLTEGFDEPSVGAVIMARPTQSQLLYTQCVGRGTRRAEHKHDCLIIDIADVTSRHRPVGLPTLMGLPPEFDAEGEPIHEAAVEYTKLASSAPSEVLRVRSLSEINAAWERIDLFAMPEPDPLLLELSAFIWIQPTEGSYYLGLGDRESMHIVGDALGRYQVLHQTGDVQDSIGVCDELKDAFATADTWVRAQRGEKITLLFASAGWRNDAVTDKQARALRRFKVPITSDMTKGHASYLLDRLYAANPKPERPAWLERKIAAQRHQF